MQILTFPDQIPTKLPLLCEIWGFGTNGEFLSSFGLFSLVRATPNLATTIRAGAAITKKNKYFLLEATEEAVATLCLVNP